MQEKDITKMAAEIAERLADHNKQMMTSREVAKFMGISLQQVYKLTMAHEIPFSKPNGKVCYFDRDEIIAYMKGNHFASQGQLQAVAKELTRKGGAR